jgi:hypothetical protein
MPDDPITVNLAAPVRELWPADLHERGKTGSRTITCLTRAGIWTVGELTARSARDVEDLRGAGAATVDEVRRVLAACGLRLKDDDDENAAAREFERIRLLRGAGLGPVAARRFARECWPEGEIAPGVTVSVGSAADCG